MNRPYAPFAAAGALLVFGLLALWGSLQWPLGTLRLLGPGAMPALASLLIALPMAALVARMLLRGVPRSEPDADALEPDARGGALRIAASIAALLAYAWLMPLAGFLVTTVALMLCLYGLAAQGRSLPRALLAGFLVAVGAYVLFGLILNVPLPRGTLWSA